MKRRYMSVTCVLENLYYTQQTLLKCANLYPYHLLTLPQTKSAAPIPSTGGAPARMLPVIHLPRGFHAPDTFPKDVCDALSARDTDTSQVALLVGLIWARETTRGIYRPRPGCRGRVLNGIHPSRIVVIPSYLSGTLITRRVQISPN
jgi:hypothetical protein